MTKKAKKEKRTSDAVFFPPARRRHTLNLFLPEKKIQDERRREGNRVKMFCEVS